MSENSNKSNNNNRRKKNPNNKNSNRGPRHNNKKPAAASGGYKGKRNSNRNRRPKSLTPSRVLQKYENLMEQHAIARKKYFEVFGRITGKQFDKVQQNFNKTLKAIVDYKNSLKDWQKEVLDKKLDFYPPDRQYTTTHELEPVGDEVPFEGDFEDPHLLVTQKEHEWSNDKEESSGTYDDYKAYKGIVD